MRTEAARCGITALGFWRRKGVAGRADGGGDGAVAGFGTASEAAAFRCECGCRTTDAGQGARLVMPSMTRQGPIEAGSSTIHRFPRKAAFRSGGISVFGQSQASQLPGGSDAFHRQSSRQFADRYRRTCRSMDGRQIAARQGACARPRSGSRPNRSSRWSRSARRWRRTWLAVPTDGRGLWNEQRSAPGDHGLGAVLSGIHHLEPQSAWCARVIRSRIRVSVEALARSPAQARLAHHHMARRQQCETAITLPAYACVPPRYGANAVCRRDIADECKDETAPRNSGSHGRRRHAVPRPCRSRQATLRIVTRL